MGHCDFSYTLIDVFINYGHDSSLCACLWSSTVCSRPSLFSETLFLIFVSSAHAATSSYLGCGKTREALVCVCVSVCMCMHVCMCMSVFYTENVLHRWSIHNTVINNSILCVLSLEIKRLDRREMDYTSYIVPN